jgi:DNA uptake protein ComE-like DNA-binding protein
LVQALVAAGYDHPRKLVTANLRELKLLVGVGNAGFAQIEAYRARYGILPGR